MGFMAALRKSQAALYMILVQMFTTGMLLLSKVILNGGAFIFSLLTYRQIVATLFLVPLCLLMERGMQKKLSWKAMVWIFFNGLLGYTFLVFVMVMYSRNVLLQSSSGGHTKHAWITMALGFYYYGLRDTSATFASNFLNLIPIATFILSVACGMEKLGLGSMGGRVKILGTLLCVGGALTISLYRGKPMSLGSSHAHSSHDAMKKAASHDIARGSFLLVGSCLSSAAWFIVQVKLFKVFPSMYWATMLSCMAGCVQAVIIGVALNRDSTSWRLGFDLNLLTIVYSGILTTGINFCLIAWTVTNKGPTYPSMFNPLSLIFVTLLESLFMREQLFVGSILGTILIIGGLYSFLWGKKNQLKAQKRKAGEVAMVSESTRSIATVNVGDVTMAFDSNHLDSALPSSMIMPIVDDQNGTYIDQKSLDNVVDLK